LSRQDRERERERETQRSHFATLPSLVPDHVRPQTPKNLVCVYKICHLSRYFSTFRNAGELDNHVKHFIFTKNYIKVTLSCERRGGRRTVAITDNDADKTCYCAPRGHPPSCLKPRVAFADWWHEHSLTPV